jgi:hypothetical protein|tara:strand:+ start:216 stop:584 length:369 start_codon:yes stop_codon:yes gene_type:complete
MSDNNFISWLETELTIKEKEDMAKRKKIEVPTITDVQLTLVNRVKSLVADINDSGVEHITYADITTLDKAYDAVVEESNLKHQQHDIDYGENKGTVMKAWYKDLVRADNPNVYIETRDDDDE